MIRCLLIEDDIDDQEIFCIAMRDADDKIGCIIANDGPEALSLLVADGSNIPEYIFIDINMPKMNGIDCLKEIKGLKHAADAKIFMLSTTSDPALIKKCLQLGANDFIVKPPSLSALTERLIAALNLQ